jgi:serine protease Do
MRHHPYPAWLLLIVFALPCAAQTGGLDAQQVFERSEDAVFQIRVINRDTGKKSSIGSGFAFDRANRLATNYHVVSRHIEEPDTYRLSYLASDGREGDLRLIGVDAVNDLALVESDVPLAQPLPLASPPPKGAALFAMGNPLDLGLTVAAGTNGGVLSQTDASRILFSGSLNPGMSGGPTFDDSGRVVGINVATARNDISFIVPGRFLETIATADDGEDLTAVIDQQIAEHQRAYLGRIVESPWDLTSVREMRVPGVISETIRCWDASPKPEDDERYRRFSVSCQNENDIYLSDRLTVGKILYEYHWLETESLDPLRFYRVYESLNVSQFGGRAQEDDVGRFRCDTHFVDVNGQPFRATFCSRRYKRYPQLHDILFTAAMVGNDRVGLIFNLDLSGTDVASATRLVRRMLENTQWQR